MNQTTDMTQGPPFPLLVRFAAPLMFGSLCQMLYTAADSAVVGRLVGVDAFAAVGAAGFFCQMAYQIVFGLAKGFGVLFAQLFGRKDFTGLRKAVAMGVILSAGASTIVSIAGLLLAGAVLTLMDTPAGILPDTLVYVRWVYGGVAVTMANRLASTLLLAQGNSSAPVAANAGSCVLNILLDLLFVGVFRWGVAGVAAATVMAQLGSFAYCFVKLRGLSHMRLSMRDFSLAPVLMRELLRMGGTMAFRDGVIAAGGLFVQKAINGYGTLFVAGMAASEKYFGLICLISDGFEGAFATYSAQNFGARRMDRLKAGLWCSVRVSLAGALCVAVLVVIFGRSLIGLLVTGEASHLQQLTQTGYEYLVMLAITIPLMSLTCLYRAGLQGMGSTFAPTLSGFVELGVRILSVTFLPGIFGRWAVYSASPLGWLGAAVLLGVSYHQVYRKRQSMLTQHPARED